MIVSSESREETDSLGSILVSKERLWGAQTERSRLNFSISTERFPLDFIRAICVIKKAAARVNVEQGGLDHNKGQAIALAADEVLAGFHDGEFPLSIWQTGSGTQTHMNVNEVLANRASELMGGERGGSRRVHANDDVNRSQSTNDVFPSAMNISVVKAFHTRLLPSLKELIVALRVKSVEFQTIVKVGRTHLMDATPITLGQEFSGYVAQIEHALLHVNSALPHLCELAIGGTAVGTGLNTPPLFGRRMSEEVSILTGHTFVSSPNKFEAVANHDAHIHFHGAVKGLACSLNKIANDIRWLASGPRCGLGEITIPGNEPGSSMMPGKVNPTQCEALIMGCTQVFGNDISLSIAAASGNLELNTQKPIIIHSMLQSIRILADAIHSFSIHCVAGIQPDVKKIQHHMDQSLMQVTALTPHIGYDAAAIIAKKAQQSDGTLRDTAIGLGLVTKENYDRWMDPRIMV